MNRVINHHNNFDFLRLVFAILVILTHSQVLSSEGGLDFVQKWSGGQTEASYIGVRGFFVISGYLVFKSLQRSQSLKQYFKKRIVRIFPGLIVMLFVVTFLMGAFFSHLDVLSYFRNMETWRYPLSALRVFPVPKTEALPGVFSGNPAGNAVNGSLWTIWFELMFYIGLSVLYFFRKKTNLLGWMVCIFWCALFLFFIFGRHLISDIVFPFTGLSSELVLDLLLYFIAGSAFTFLPLKENALLRYIIGYGGVILLLASLYFGGFHVLRYLALPALVIGLGSMNLPILSGLRRWGEPSYGIYIYAYPLQQLLVQMIDPSAVVLNVYSIPLSILLGYASWHLVEKRWIKT